MEKVVITNLKDSTFYADIHLKQGDKSIVVDARPSDSIALAVRRNCPIYVTDAVFEACPELLKPISEEEVEDFKKKLETMTPEDFFRDLKKKDEGQDKGEDEPRA